MNRISECADHREANPMRDERVELIRDRAYDIYQARGAADGLDLQDWLQAEAEFSQGNK